MDSKNYAVFTEAVPQLNEEPLQLKEDLKLVSNNATSGNIRQIMTNIQKTLVQETSLNIISQLKERGIDISAFNGILQKEIYSALSIEQIAMSLSLS